MPKLDDKHYSYNKSGMDAYKKALVAKQLKLKKKK